MHNEASTATLTIELVWSDDDFPGRAPVFGGAVAYSLPGLTTAAVIRRRSVRVDAGTPAAQFMHDYVLAWALDGIRRGEIGVAVFGLRLRAGQVLRDGDRIELLAGITADPKSDRRQRVRAARGRGEDLRWRKR